MLRLAVILFLLKLISASSHSVTIMNDSSLGDKQGAVHTWLTFKSPSHSTKYFSFETSYTGNVATGQDAPGKCTEKSHIENRTPTESVEITITTEQYQQMIDASSTFCQNPPIYDLLPDNYENDLNKGVLQRERRDDFNCVTASNKILKSANIDAIEGAKTPNDVKTKITGKTNSWMRFGTVLVNILRKVPFAIMDAAERSHPGWR